MLIPNWADEGEHHRDSKRLSCQGYGSKWWRPRCSHPRGPASTSGGTLPRRCPRWYWGRLPTGDAPCRGCNSTHTLPVHLLDGPAADLQELGQFPLAHSLRPLHPDALPLLLGQGRPSARETALGPRLRLARDRPLPDGVPPPLAEGEHHLELELAGGRGRVEVFRQGPELHSRQVQALDHLETIGQPTLRPSHRERMGTAYMEPPKLVVISPS